MKIQVSLGVFEVLAIQVTGVGLVEFWSHLSMSETQLSVCLWSNGDGTARVGFACFAFLHQVSTFMIGAGTWKRLLPDFWKS